MDGRNIGDMPPRRRHQGLCAMERLQIKEILAAAGALLVALKLAAPALRPVLLALVGAILAAVQSLRTVVLRLCPPVDPANKNMLVASFTEEECWRDLRFRKQDRRDRPGGVVKALCCHPGESFRV